MKLLKKMSALLVAVVMMAVTVVPAFAADVTIENPANGNANIANRTFVAYQIFEGREAIVDEKETLGDIEWGNAFNNDAKEAFLDSLKTSVFKNDFPTSITVDDAAEIAEKIATANDAQAIQIARVAYDALKTSGNNPAKYTLSTPTTTDLPDGYYLIVDETENLGEGQATNPALLEVVGAVTITPKTKDVTVGKQVKDNGKNEGYGESADYSIGDNVPFRLFAQVPSMDHYNKYEFKFHDTLSTGLTFNNDSVKVYAVEAKNEITYDENQINENNLIPNTFYNIVYPGVEGEESGKTNSQKFSVEFNDLKTVEKVTAGKYIVIEYTAKLNSDANIGNIPNTNEVILEYSNNPNAGGTGNTDKKEVYVYTFTLNGEKRDGSNANTKLSNAKFIISRTVNNQAQYANVGSNGKIITTTDAEGEVIPEWINWDGTFEAAKAIGENGNIVSGQGGNFKIEGLDAGTYELWETKAPEGYNTPTVPFIVTLSADHAKDSVTTNVISYKQTSEVPGFDDEKETTNGQVKIDIDNNKGTTLPETGGMGTTLLYVAGGILLIGSAVLLVTKKRMGHEN